MRRPSRAPQSPRDGAGRPVVGGEQQAADGQPHSADGVLVWNGMVASIHPVPCSDAQSTAPGRAAETTEPIPARAWAAPRQRGQEG